jgi:hypothetical protein
MAQPAEVTVVPKRIGGSIVLFLPAEVVRKRRIREGVPVRVTIGPEARAKALGALKRRRRHRQFDRHEEGFWDDS